MFLMKFLFKCFNKAPLNVAAEKGNVEIFQLLLSQKEIDVNIKEIFGISCFNYVSILFF